MNKKIEKLFLSLCLAGMPLLIHGANEPNITNLPSSMIRGKSSAYFKKNTPGFGSISSLQEQGRIYMLAVNFSCKDSSGKFETESSTPTDKAKTVEQKVDGKKALWRVAYDWENIKVNRTIEYGDYPGMKFTFDYKVKKDFKSNRLTVSFLLPQNVYDVTGYMNGSVMQFRPVKKGEWFGILRSTKYPYITFSKEGTGGVMILAATQESWKQLPGMLLYSTTTKCYWTCEFMYRQNKELKTNEQGSYSFYVIPLGKSNQAAEAAEIYAKMKDSIR